MDLNFISSSEELCMQFGMKVKSGEITDSHMIAPMAAISNETNLSVDQAVTVITNLSLAAYYVPLERTDFQVVCGQALLHTANFIDVEGSQNFKILYALYKSQVEPSEISFKKRARSEIIGNMLGRFNSLVNDDIYRAEHMKSIFFKLLKNDPRFSIYSY